MVSSKKVRKKRKPSDLLQFVALSIIAGFITAGLLVPPTAAAGMAATSSINWFKGLPDNMSDGPLSKPSVLYASDGKTELATFYAQNRTEVPLDKISQPMQDAIIAVEDRKFYDHGAISPVGIGRALVNNILRPNNRQGASTLTQQYVNNLLIDTAEQTGGDATETLGANKGYVEKIIEMKLAISMEENKSKDEILEGYLNIVNLGGANYGVEAAAYYYWGISAAELNPAQAATLAGMVQAPNVYRPNKNPEYSKERRNLVLGTMLRDGKITQKEYDNAVNSELDLDIHTTDSGCSAAGVNAYFCNYVMSALYGDESFGATEEDRINSIYRGGYKIISTLDTRAQDSAKKSVEATQPSTNNIDDVNAALVSVEPKNGYIKAMAQNSDYADAKDDHSTSLYSYNVDPQYGGTTGFQPGSTFKPVVLANWIDKGKSVNQVIDGTALNYPASTHWNAKCLDGGAFRFTEKPEGFTFQNAEGGYRQWGTVAFGMKNSINSFLFRMVFESDLCDIQEMADKLHVHQWTGDTAYNPKILTSNIGAIEVSPLTMASAYATFANDGVYCEPMATTKVENRDGSVKKEYKPACSEQISKDVANGVNYVLKQVLVDGSGWQRGIGLPDASAAKTGTTDNSTQTWMVGYTKGLSTASWVGNLQEGSRSLNGLSINGQRSAYVDGATFAGTQWQRYMNETAKRYNTDKFAQPSNKVLGLG
ncbi:transglycosylase domain-containing protein [Rothia sp. ZJ1223]|uniref:transglycosylase domain-containing protein n=1 Tax=Rothia sp. ZJ1223 TaxID=2811098 RepID=UPI00195712C4|nr:transglycosylase domain-containing protein [Rothia sp. ZJ1223]MBM7051982.1 transglycosylase domain-containing protein [Rothia sp. ZJ1223]